MKEWKTCQCDRGDRAYRIALYPHWNEGFETSNTHTALTSPHNPGACCSGSETMRTPLSRFQVYIQTSDGARAFTPCKHGDGQLFRRPRSFRARVYVDRGGAECSQGAITSRQRLLAYLPTRGHRRSFTNLSER